MKRLSAILVCVLALCHGTSRAAAPAVTALGAYTTALSAPTRLAADAAGNLYVVESQAGQVAVFDTFGRLTAVHTGLGRPLGIAVDAQGRIYLGDEQTGSVTVRDSDWTPLYALGAGAGEFGLPGYIAVDPASNTVYVSDGSADEIKVYSGASRINRFGSHGSGYGQFSFPTGIGVSPAGEVFVMDQGNDRLQVFSRDGVYLRHKDFRKLDADDNLVPTGRRQGVGLDVQGRVYLADAFQGNVKAYDAAGLAALATIGAFGTQPGKLNLPTAATVDPLGRLMVCSTANGRVELYGLDAFLHLTTSPSATSLAAGAPVTFTARAGGSGPFAYQWQKDGTNLVDGGTIGGATGAVLTVSALAGADGGSYGIIVTSPSGAFTSGLARVSVLSAPSILGNPASRMVVRGTPVQFSVSASGSDLAYQWRYYGHNIEGATNSTLDLPDPQPYDAGDYTVVVRNPVGALTSAPAALAVVVPPLVMELLNVVQTADQSATITINADPQASFTLEASDDLSGWLPLGSFVNGPGMLDLTDPDAPAADLRFYRLSWTP